MNSVVVVVVDMANEKIGICFAKNAGLFVERGDLIHLEPLELPYHVSDHSFSKADIMLRRGQLLPSPISER